MNRITVDRFIAALDALPPIGVEIRPGIFFHRYNDGPSKGTCAMCAMSAVMFVEKRLTVAEMVRRDSMIMTHIKRDLGLNVDYMDAFIDGFDSPPESMELPELRRMVADDSDTSPEERAAILAGFDDGKACRLELERRACTPC